MVTHDDSQDIVEFMLNLMRSEGINDDITHQIEHITRKEFGGLRVCVPKKNKKLLKEQRKKAFSDGLTSMPTKDVVEKHGISRATLYRLMKRG